MALTTPHMRVSVLPRPAHKHCGGGDEQAIEDTRLEIAQRREIKILHNHFRELQAHADSSPCASGNHGGGDRNRKLKRVQSLQRTVSRMKHQISVAGNDTNLKKYERISQRTAELIAAYDHHCQAIADSIKQCKDSSHAVDTMISFLVMLQLKWNKLHQTAPSEEDYSKRIAILESRLQVFNSKFSYVCYLSSSIRREISDMLLARHNFYIEQNRLRRSINKLKVVQGNVVGKAYATYDVIDNAKNRIKLLRKQDSKSQIVFRLYIADCRRSFDDFWKIRRFAEIKNQPREEVKQTLSRRTRVEMHKLATYNMILLKYKYVYDVIRRSMHSFDENKFLKKYQNLQNFNLSMVAVNGNLSSEVSSLHEQVLHLKKKNLELKKTKKQERHKQIERKNKAKVIVYSNRRLHDQALREQIGVEKYLTGLEKDIRNLYNNVDGDQAATEQLLGKRKTHGPNSLVPLLKIVERRCGTLIKSRENLQYMKDKLEGRLALRAIMSRGFRQIAEHGPYIPMVLLTGYQEVLITEDEEDKSFLQRVYRKPELVKYIRERMKNSQFGENSDSESPDQRSMTSSAMTSSTAVSIKVKNSKIQDYL